MKAAELRTQKAQDLQQELLGLRKEQFNLRMQRGAGQLANPSRFKVVQKDIARIKTVLQEKAGSKAQVPE
ncbi:50S ribosomal protein L29 [Candidatus Spongiihabitans sp.]|uniref:50S ribosomal protein L29 n=1 Tax=Candidatus Spongiihabitans sp. TaxID=3101308 RepID=UPI003C702AB6